jgi:aspartyl-tRNA(Asn)/glutamyl-tRNA(Gln) amidotransferase subunit A
MKCVVIDELDLHNIEKYYTSWRNIRLAEATNIHLEWLKTRADEYGAEVREMLLQGKRISAVNYLQSLRAAHEIKNEILALFSNQSIDAIVIPTTIVAAPRINDTAVNTRDSVLVETRQALLQNTIVFNSTGLPAISIPIGRTKENLPVGAQIVGLPFGEEIILSIAYCYEQLNNGNSDMGGCVPLE